MGRLSQEALEGIVDDYIVREGTDYGHRDIPLVEKRRQVLAEIEAGRARIVFDPETRSTTVVAGPAPIG